MVNFTPLVCVDSDIYTPFRVHIVLSSYVSASPWEPELPDYLLENLEKILNLQTCAFLFQAGDQSVQKPDQPVIEALGYFLDVPFYFPSYQVPLSVVQVKFSMMMNFRTCPAEPQPLKPVAITIGHLCPYC